jgi:dipeptidase E
VAASDAQPALRWRLVGALLVYAVDDQTAVKVVGGTVEVVSEGRWKPFGL